MGKPIPNLSIPWCPVPPLIRGGTKVERKIPQGQIPAEAGKRCPDPDHSVMIVRDGKWVCGICGKEPV